MIMDALIVAITSVIGFVIGLFPTGSGLPQAVHTASVQIGSYARAFDDLLPIDTLFTILTLVIIVQLSVSAFYGIRWVISHIPFIGGRG